MSIIDTLEKVLKSILPVLRTSAEKAVAKLPENERNQAIQISKLIEIIKDGKEQNLNPLQIKGNLLQANIGDEAALLNSLNAFIQSRGWIKQSALSGAIEFVLSHANDLNEVGVKSLWQSMMNTISNVIAGIDWEALALGVAEAIYNLYVKKA